MSQLLLSAALLFGGEPAFPKAPGRPHLEPTRYARLAHTYSIVARDPDCGWLGVAVESRGVAIGGLVPYAEPGVGVVASQSFAEPSYGKLGLELMRGGKTAPTALKMLLAGDDGKALRQVAMLDAAGRVAAHTGGKCIGEAGHVTGDGFSVQANVMDSPRVWPAMAKAFSEAKGDLAERMLASLDAAQKEGGDPRGMQSAALIVVAGKASGDAAADLIFNLRVDEHAEPIKELRRLLKLHRAVNHMVAGVMAGQKGDADGVAREFKSARELAPMDSEIVFWHAVTLVQVERVEEALPIFRQVFERDGKWARLLPRLVPAGQFPNDEALLATVLKQAGK